MNKQNEPLRFRIYYGYTPNSYISITEKELERAKYAWQTNSIFTHNGKQVKGAEFKLIEEDFRYYTGWSDGYSPKDSYDFEQMKEDVPSKKRFSDVMELAEARVRYVIATEQVQLLKNPSDIDKLLLN